MKLPKTISTLDYDDLLLEPAAVSEISSRFSDINIDKFYPIITAPMDTVVDANNYKLFHEHGINVCFPRGVEIENNNHTFISLSLKDFIERYITNEWGGEKLEYVCIDVANGHMKSMHDAVRLAKDRHGDKLVIMCGNVASAEGYLALSQAGADYVRCGIGNGAGCFEDSTLILTSKGKVPISDVENGDLVMTSSGEYKEVIGKVRYKTNKELLKVNGNLCTESHEFFVVDKNKINLVNEENMMDIGYWVEAKNINPDIHYLVELVFNE